MDMIETCWLVVSRDWLVMLLVRVLVVDWALCPLFMPCFAIRMEFMCCSRDAERLETTILVFLVGKMSLLPGEASLSSLPSLLSELSVSIEVAVCCLVMNSCDRSVSGVALAACVGLGCILASSDSDLPQDLLGRILVGVPAISGRLVGGGEMDVPLLVGVVSVELSTLVVIRERRSRSLGGDGDLSAAWGVTESGWLIWLVSSLWASLPTGSWSLMVDDIEDDDVEEDLVDWFLVVGMTMVSYVRRVLVQGGLVVYRNGVAVHVVVTVGAEIISAVEFVGLVLVIKMRKSAVSVEP